MGATTTCGMVALRLRVAAGDDGVFGAGRRTGTSLTEVDHALWSGELSATFLLKFCLAYDASPDWLLFGRGPSRLGEVMDASYAMAAAVPTLHAWSAIVAVAAVTSRASVRRPFDRATQQDGASNRGLGPVASGRASWRR